MNKFDFISCSDMIENTIASLEKENKDSKFLSSWKKVVTKINRYGQNLFEHSSIIDIKNNILLIETDHPGWIQIFNLNSKFIINGLKMYCPEMNITSLAFRLKGSNAKLNVVNYDEEIKKENNKISDKLKKEEEIINKYEKKVETKTNNSELPKDLLEKFESMKNIMLTKSENK